MYVYNRIMDIAKCLYHSDNNRFTDPWNLKKTFGYVTSTLSSKKYEVPNTYFMNLDSAGMEHNTMQNFGGSNSMVNTSAPIETSKMPPVSVTKMKSDENLEHGTQPAKPKRSRNGFTSVFQFISGFVGTKSLLSARMQPLRFKDTSRPMLNVGSIFEMYQESCLVEDSIRNSRKPDRGEASNCTSVEVCNSDSAAQVDVSTKVLDAEKPNASVVSETVTMFDPHVLAERRESSVTSTSEGDMGPRLVVKSDVLTVTSVSEPLESDTDPTITKNNPVDSVTNLPSSTDAILVSETKPVTQTMSDSAKITSSAGCALQNPETLRKRRYPNGRICLTSTQAGGKTNMDSEHQLNLKNSLLSTLATSDSTKSVDILTNGETFSQKRVNDHAASKTQKRSRKRSRRKARRQRKSSPSVGDSTHSQQQTECIPEPIMERLAPPIDACERDTVTSTPSLPEVEPQTCPPVSSPVCFVQPLCANAAIAFILGICSDDSESDNDDDDSFEWDVGGEDSWEKSNALWESFQCAQLQLANLKSPVVSNPSAHCSAEAAVLTSCVDEVDGVILRTDSASDCEGEHSCREYPNGCQLSAEQLEDVNRRWADEIEKGVVPCERRRKPKTVNFAEECKLQQVRHLCTWSFAHRAARKGEWEQYARDRSRFQCRIKEVEKTIGYILTPEHRSLVYKKYYESSGC